MNSFLNLPASYSIRICRQRWPCAPGFQPHPSLPRPVSPNCARPEGAPVVSLTRNYWSCSAWQPKVLASKLLLVSMPWFSNRNSLSRNCVYWETTWTIGATHCPDCRAKPGRQDPDLDSWDRSTGCCLTHCDHRHDCQF